MEPLTIWGNIRLSPSPPRRILLLLVFIALSVSPLYPQKISIDRISQESGLSQAQVQSIVQDQQGFMWFGTLDGLNRFDGYQTKIFKHVGGDSTSLPRNDIAALCVDRGGALWAGTNGSGLCRDDPRTE